MSFLEFLIWLLGGTLVFAFVVCLIVFIAAFVWGEIEQEDLNKDE